MGTVTERSITGKCEISLQKPWTTRTPTGRSPTPCCLPGLWDFDRGLSRIDNGEAVTALDRLSMPVGPPAPDDDHEAAQDS
jgi:hypothetical protein